MKTLFHVTILLLSLFTFENLAAQRRVAGTVTDAATNEPIAGAAVMVKGTSHGIATASDGTFVLNNLSGNRVLLQVYFVGYTSAEIEVNIPTGNVIIPLEPETVAMGQVVVSGRRRSDTENSMLATVKNVAQVTSGISAGQIARSADRDASEVVRRIPGITIINDRFVIVRGLSQRYNNAWINGLAVPSTEADSRAFSFDIIPSGQIDNIIVYKSPSPEIPADFAGGFVKITTKSIPDANSMSINYTTGFNVKTQFKDFFINPGSGTDFLGFDLSKRPLSGDFPSNLSNVTDQNQLDHLLQNGFNYDWRIKKRAPLPDQRFSFSMARRIDTRSGRTLGNIISLNYSNTYKTVRDIFNARYGIYSSSADRPIPLDSYSDNQYTNDVRLGVLHNWSYEADPDNTYEFKNLLNILGRNRTTGRVGFKDQSSMYYLEQTEILYSSRFTYNGQFSGKHNLHRAGRLDWNAGYSFASRSEPDRRIITNQEGIGSEADIATVVAKNDNITRYYQSLHDHIVSGAADYSKSFESSRFDPVLKVGAYGEYQTRNYSPREFLYRYNNLSLEDRRRYLVLPFEQMMALENIGADKVYAEEVSRNNNAYSATVHQEAFYAAVDLTFGRLNVYAGARAENYVLKLERDKSQDPSVVLKTTKKHSTFDILPSANLNYKFDERHQLRAAYGRSLNRPELREVSPAVYYDFDLFNEIGGNEDLKTAYIHNADLRYEFYPSRGEILSLGVFYKNFKNPIEWTYIDMGGSLRYNYENAKSAESYGIELDIRKNLDFIRMPNLSLVLNAAYIWSNIKFYEKDMGRTSDRPMQGQSPYVINAGLFYDSPNLGLNFSVLYNRIGKRLIGIGRSSSANTDINSIIPDSYEMPRNSLDISIAKSIGKRVELKASVKDVLSENIVYKQFPKFLKDGITHKREQVTRKYNPGQSILIGITVKL